jgi:hypothetical protein
MLPELCNLCSIPSEVRWTAIVFYSRFFAVRSPMEFDPLAVLFASVHVACMVEEFHDLSISKLLESVDLADATMKAKVASMEAPLLEGIGFALFVEPKPDASLALLLEEFRRHLCGTTRAQKEVVVSAMAVTKSEAVVGSAEQLLLEWSVRTDAVLCFPPCILFAAALGEAVQAQVALDLRRRQPPEAAASCTPHGAATLSTLLQDVAAGLLGNTETDAAEVPLCSPARWESMRQLLSNLRQVLDRVAAEGTAAEGRIECTGTQVSELVQRARQCHHACERLREDANERHETHRLERKRCWNEMKGTGFLARGFGAIPTPMFQDIVELDQEAAALRVDDQNDFFIHRLDERRY